MNELPGIRVLIAEDQDDTAELIAQLLEQAGAEEVAIASDGSQASKVYDETRKRGERFDVLIVDAAMPVTDGFSFAEHVRRDCSDTETPIVMVTAHKDHLTASHARHSGIDIVLFKPCAPLEIIEAVGKVLKK